MIGHLGRNRLLRDFGVTVPSRNTDESGLTSETMTLVGATYGTGKKGITNSGFYGGNTSQTTSNTNYIYTASPIPITGNKWTVSYWQKDSDNPGNGSILAAFKNSGILTGVDASSPLILLAGNARVGNDRGINVYYAANGASPTFSSVTTVSTSYRGSAGTWNFFVVSWNGTSYTIYMNDMTAVISDVIGTITPAATTYTNLYLRFSGGIISGTAARSSANSYTSDIRVFNRVLSLNERLQLYKYS